MRTPRASVPCRVACEFVSLLGTSSMPWQHSQPTPNSLGEGCNCVCSCDLSPALLAEWSGIFHELLQCVCMCVRACAYIYICVCVCVCVHENTHYHACLCVGLVCDRYTKLYTDWNQLNWKQSTRVAHIPSQPSQSILMQFIPYLCVESIWQ